MTAKMIAGRDLKAQAKTAGCNLCRLFPARLQAAPAFGLNDPEQIFCSVNSSWTEELLFKLARMKRIR